MIRNRQMFFKIWVELNSWSLFVLNSINDNTMYLFTYSYDVAWMEFRSIEKKLQTRMRVDNVLKMKTLKIWKIIGFFYQIFLFLSWTNANFSNPKKMKISWNFCLLTLLWMYKKLSCFLGSKSLFLDIHTVM